MLLEIGCLICGDRPAQYYRSGTSGHVALCEACAKRVDTCPACGMLHADKGICATCRNRPMAAANPRQKIARSDGGNYVWVPDEG